MIKNFNETISLLSLIIIVIFTLKFGLGLIFSSHESGNIKDNFDLLRNYYENIEE